ncbi:MAG: class II aldolase/adducin family protein [Planctomycetota bacterium]|nr:class II aldolase/adducin family protein [Planctomycetota bacterium]
MDDDGAAEAREEVASFMRRLYRTGLTSCSGGNISRRLPDGLVLITPSALDKGELAGRQVVAMTLSGENLSRPLRPTMEAEMHLAIYRSRPDVMAVMHAHPAFATAFACAGAEIRADLTPETAMTLGVLAWAPNHPAGSRELAEGVAGALAGADVAIMRGHGVIAVGPSLLKAFDRIEVAELAAKMTWILRTLGAAAEIV